MFRLSLQTIDLPIIETQPVGIGHLKFYQEGSFRNRGRLSVLNITLILYTPLRYIRNIAHKE